MPIPEQELARNILLNSCINKLHFLGYITDETRFNLLDLCFPKQKSERSAGWGEAKHDKQSERVYVKPTYRIAR